MEQKENKEAPLGKIEQRRKEAATVRNIVAWCIVGVFALIAIGGIFAYSYVHSALGPVDGDDKRTVNVEIPIGAGLDTISSVLKKSGLIQDAKVFKYYAKLNNQSNFKAGNHKLNRAMDAEKLLEVLQQTKGSEKPVLKLTVPEGLTIAQIGELIQRRLGQSAEDFIRVADDRKFIDRMKAKYPNLLTDDILAPAVKHPLEGYLYPATYDLFEEKPSAETLIETMLKATNTAVAPYKAELSQQKRSVHWLLTFSSLLEREASAKADRETIASVFFNRLKQSMPLQTDPTVLYALGGHKPRVMLKDLQVDDPYNTYKISGLPPGPISNAGKSSMDAAIHPAKSDYIYFLADKQGVNHFAVTYEEHLRNVNRYIRQ